MALIENWYLFKAMDLYGVPGDTDVCLAGRVYGHPKFKDGEVIHTSFVLKFNSGMALTKNTIYELGKPSQHYLEWLLHYHEITQQDLRGKYDFGIENQISNN